MIKPITFCIATAKNERDYIELLLKSLKDNTDVDKHEILIFVDSDNQNTYDMLLEQKAEQPNIRICKNSSTFPIGSQRNVSVMFNAATNDIVCYLQSDMVVGKDFDLHISHNIDEQTVLSCARIEPPLHPASPEKIVMDFGITPDQFQYDAFNRYVVDLQKENKPNIIGHFAPFAIYKNTWLNVLGGFDTQFRCSREDSDTILRMDLCNLNMIQTWNACVYHFTCVSSRGTDWYKSDKDAKYKNELQQLADQQELKRFIRKWGFFGHQPRPVYDIAFDIDLDAYADINLLKYLEPFCSRLYLNSSLVSDQLISQLEFDSIYYSNLRWNYTLDHWNRNRTLFNPTDFTKRVLCDNNVVGDVVVSAKYSTLSSNLSTEVASVIENIQSIVDANEVGDFAYGPLQISIKQKVDKSSTYKKVTNLNKLLSSDYKFI